MRTIEQVQPAVVPRTRAWRLIFLSVLCTFGCSDDLEFRNLGDTPELADGRPPPGSAPWACLDYAPVAWPPPRPGMIVDLMAPVVEWSSMNGLAGRGLRATLCAATNLDPSSSESSLERCPWA